MAKYTPSGNVRNRADINGEFDLIAESINDQLDKTGGNGNQMEAVLDMNSNRILNLPVPRNATDPVRLGDVSGLVFNVNTSFVQETPPPSEGLISGSRWYQPSTATTFIFYIDEDSEQWVEESVSNGGTGPLVFVSTSTMEAFEPRSTGQLAVNRERGNATYYLEAESYMARAGDITAANGRVWALQIEEAANISWFGSFDSALSRGVNLRGVDGETYTATNIVGVNNVEIDLNGSTIDARSLNLSGVTGFKISNGTLSYSGGDTGYVWLNMAGADSCEFSKVVFQSLPSNPLATASVTSGAVNNKFEKCEFYDCETSAIGIDGSSDGNNPNNNKVIGCRFENGDFGVRMNNCDNNVIDSNYTITGTGIELIGLQTFASHNIITNNIAQLTGDNGISISGMYNTVASNICQGNDRAGIWIWGSFNTVTGNVCKNNVTGGGQWAGIGASGNFGGTGQFNTITGNILDDNQSSPTQANSLRFSGSSYTSWAQGQTVDTSSGNVYRVNGLNIYIATTSGTTGSNAPVHTSGTVSDGGVSWRYVNTFVNEADAIFNTAYPNSIGRSSGLSVVDTTLRNKYSNGEDLFTDGDVTLLAEGSTAFIRADGESSDVSLRLQPKGNGRVSFGTVEPIGAQTITGFIRITDSSGIQRFLAVVS